MSNRKVTYSRGASKKEATQAVTIRLPAHVLSHFKSTGPGYQTRIREVLERHMEREKRFEDRQHKAPVHKSG
jgi:uncharacterized protein (DUF4415 family)